MPLNLVSWSGERNTCPLEILTQVKPIGQRETLSSALAYDSFEGI